MRDYKDLKVEVEEGYQIVKGMAFMLSFVGLIYLIMAI